MTVCAQGLIANLAARGITLTPNGDSLIVQPRERLTDADRDAIRQHKAGLLALLCEQAETNRIARLDAERREVDRLAGRGFDFDCSAPSHADFLNRTGHSCACRLSPEEQAERELDRLACADGWIAPSPAHALVETCRRYRVALRIDATTGDLMVGKVGANELTQPWPSLLIAIEAHLEAVAALVASGWSLQAEFPERGAA